MGVAGCAEVVVQDGYALHFRWPFDTTYGTSTSKLDLTIVEASQ